MLWYLNAKGHSPALRIREVGFEITIRQGRSNMRRYDIICDRTDSCGINGLNAKGHG